MTQKVTQMNNYTFHIQICLGCRADSNYWSDEWFEAINEYEESYPYYSTKDNKREYDRALERLKNTCPVCCQKIGKTFQYNSGTSGNSNNCVEEKVKIHRSCANKSFNNVKMNKLRINANDFLQRPNLLPKYCSGCHGVQHGRCFTFENKKDMDYARENMLNEDFFQNFMEKYPKFYFQMDDELMWGTNELKQKIILDDNGEWIADDEFC